ncbi:MAG: hypothetical protein ACM336_17400 [Acidobacteriota bacterium]
MKLSTSALALLAAGATFAQAHPNEPTKQEIEKAYRSKSGGLGMPIPGLRSESWRIKEIRGWKLRFKRLSQERPPGVIIVKYKATAQKNDSCAEYHITDTIPVPPANPQIEPMLVVDPGGVMACR